MLNKVQKTMILLIGIQASGKTSFYKQYLKGNYEHISLDILNTRNKERLALERCLEQEKSFVVDNTNPTKADRKRYFDFVKGQGYQVLGYYFKSSIGECMERNEQREGKDQVPRCAVAATSRKLELPDFSEGFDKLFYVFLEDGIFKIEDWRNKDEV